MIEKQKYGRVVLVGRANTGKSTLLNAIMNQKVSITSPLPQTTRRSIKVLYKDKKGILLITDTPGIINKVKDMVAKIANAETPKEMSKKDIIVCVVDISRPKNEEENKVIGLVRKIPAKKILVYNKIDKVDNKINYISDYNYLEEDFDKVISISALKDKHIKGLINLIFELLPTKPDKNIQKEIQNIENENKPLIAGSSDVYIEDLIREKTYLFLRDEIPYTIKVKVEKIEDKRKLIYIKAIIYTTASRYKKIIIGKSGQKIKEIGYNARKELSLMSGRKIYLDLEVKDDPHWMEKVSL